MAGIHANDETLKDTVADREAEVLIETMADTSEELGAKALILIPPDTLVKADADTNEDILIAAMAAALVERMDQKLSEAEAETQH